MNKTLIALIFLFAVQTAAAQDFVFPAAADRPKIKTYGETIESFVPGNWTIVTRADGDLNRDKQPDCALIVKAREEKFLNKNRGFGAAEFDTNPRALIILFKNASGYRLAAQSNSFIKTPASPTMEEPFEEARIEKGVLQLDFQLFFNAGSYAAGRIVYKFRFDNNQFALIGADSMQFMRSTGEYDDRSYNFLTNKVIQTVGNNAADKPRAVRRRTLKLKKLKTLDTFKEPFSWEIEKDYFI